MVKIHRFKSLEEARRWDDRRVKRLSLAAINNGKGIPAHWQRDDLLETIAQSMAIYIGISDYKNIKIYISNTNIANTNARCFIEKRMIVMYKGDGIVRLSTLAHEVAHFKVRSHCKRHEKYTLLALNIIKQIKWSKPWNNNQQGG